MRPVAPVPTSRWFEFGGREALYSLFVVDLLFPAAVASLPLNPLRSRPPSCGH